MPLMESKDCSSLAQPKNKPHKVPAFRDFPEGCGPNASRVDPSTLGQTIDSSLRDAEVARTSEAVKCGQGAAKVVTGQYIPRKRVRAVRDFPPLCGVNALHLSEGESLKGVSSLENKCADRQHMDVDDKTWERVTAIEAKQVEKNVPDGYACKGRVVDTDTVQGDFERTAVEKVKKLDTVRGDFDGLQVASHWSRTVVLGLMAESACPWGNVDKRKRGKKVVFHSQRDMLNADIKTKDSPNHSKTPLQKKKGNATSEATGQFIGGEKKDSLFPNEKIDEFRIVKKSRGSNVNSAQSDQHDFNGHQDIDSNVTRNKVRETLRLFQAVSRKLLHEEESKLKGKANSCGRIDLEAAKILKDKGKYLNIGKILGPVPGVEVGDEFQYKAELNIVGLHQQMQCDIDYVKHNGKILAASVVALGGYVDELDNSDVLIYIGLGGNVMNTDKELEDQKLEQANLALQNSIEEKNPVRVIRGFESMYGKSNTYVYDGLYVVETCWQDMGPHGKLVPKFQLRRIPDQQELAWKEVKKSENFKTREGLCVDDISHGKELIPICAVNTIDDQTIPLFEYVTSMIYPNWCNPIPPEGCDCAKSCSDSEKCSCAVKNGGVIPFNHNGAIVEAKPLVYECGPSCKCPSTCHNRVSQHGIKCQLEIFKTKTRGWGVRSLNSIPSGSFICEYLGELLGGDEADERVGNDEYLFDIGNNCNNHTLWDGLSMVMPDAHSTSCEVVEDGGFTIDAAHCGNVGRFINHSCSPNLYAQNVLYDHDDKRIPHIMLFAAENIPPLQELTYDYNYKLDQVYDPDGNIKKKDCYCGSVECTGRMY